MPKGIQQKGIVRKNKMIYAAMMLFLKNGYEKTTTASIAKAAGMAPSSFFAAFKDKEALLLEMVKIMFDNQFAGADAVLINNSNPTLIYSVETALQLVITEKSETLRELYVTAYSLQSTSEFVYEHTAEKLIQLFGDYSAESTLRDFYEKDIASSGIMRGFMAKKCDMYFTLEDKLKRFLECSMTMYKVPEEKQKETIEKVLAMDLNQLADEIITSTVEKAQAAFLLVAGNDK